MAEVDVTPQVMQVQVPQLLYVSIGGNFLAYNLRTAPPTLAWKAKLPGIDLGCIQTDGYHIYVGISDNICKYDMLNGFMIWKSAAKEHLFSNMGYNSIRMVGNMVILGGMGFVAAFDKETGKKLWFNNLTGGGYMVVTTIIIDNVIYVGTGGYLYAVLLENGQNLWKCDLVGMGYNPITLTFAPFGVSRAIVVGTSGHLIAIDLQGRQMAKLHLPGAWSSTVAQLNIDNRIYCGSRGFVYCVDSTNLNLVWKNELNGLGYDSGFSMFPYLNASKELNILVGFHGYVMSLNAINGNMIWKTSLPGSGYTWVSIMVANNVLFAGSVGLLFGLNPENGALLFKDGMKGFGYGCLLLSTSYYSMDEHSQNYNIAIEISRRRNK